MIETWLPLLAGFALLVTGGEFLVRGSVELAKRLGISTLVIGLTIVALGTSMPELVTSVIAALQGSPGIAYGNIVGSNIANILLIGGVSSLILPMLISSAALRRDAFFMLFSSLTFVAWSYFAPMGRLAGTLFVIMLAIYIFTAFKQEKAHTSTEEKETTPKKNQPLISLAFVIAGLAFLILGGRWLVSGAVHLAQGFGISETVIGLTIVALGTSMPELVTSIIAALKKEGEVAFGNIVGSNIYNILGIGGVTALIAPSDVPTDITHFDNWIMLAASAFLVFVSATGLKIVRWEGALLLASYLAYIAWIWM